MFFMFGLTKLVSAIKEIVIKDNIKKMIVLIFTLNINIR